MSKIGTEVIVGQIFKPIVTTFTYDELKTYRDNDTSIGINNALIEIIVNISVVEQVMLPYA